MAYKQKILAISGGVGGAKLAFGLSKVLPNEQLTVAVNTGDDFTLSGLRISPDIDTLLYTLSGNNNKQQGWGLADESWTTFNTLSEMDPFAWFQLGDKDLATHLYRTECLNQGQSLSEVIKKLCDYFNIACKVLPMTDDTVSTEVDTDKGVLSFQEYFVKKQCQPVVKKINFVGAENATVQSDLVELLAGDQLAAVIICPSNPFLSIDPFLSLSNFKLLLKQSTVPVIAISPIIAGDAVKGPTAKLMLELGIELSATSVAEYYQDIIDGFVLDEKDSHLESDINTPCLVTNTLMKNDQDKIKLAEEVLGFARLLGSKY